MDGRVGSFVADGCWVVLANFCISSLSTVKFSSLSLLFYCSGWGNHVPGIHIFADIPMSIGHGT